MERLRKKAYKKLQSKITELQHTLNGLENQMLKKADDCFSSHLSHDLEAEQEMNNFKDDMTGNIDYILHDKVSPWPPGSFCYMKSENTNCAEGFEEISAEVICQFPVGKYSDYVIKTSRTKEAPIRVEPFALLGADLKKDDPRYLRAAWRIRIDFCCRY